MSNMQIKGFVIKCESSDTTLRNAHPYTDVLNINFAEQKNTLKIGQMMRAVSVF